MNPQPLAYKVRASHCDHLASAGEIYETLKRTIAPLERSWARLKSARRIALKFNQDWHGVPAQLDGLTRDLVGEPVARALLRLLRENTSAELYAVDTSTYRHYGETHPDQSPPMKPLFDEFGVAYVDVDQAPIVPINVPGGGLMFQKYFLAQSLLEADEVISIQRMKNHGFLGITLCLKNLFGLVPMEPDGRPRQYYHHLVRMPYMIADLGRILDPALNIIDGLIGMAGKEWESTDAQISNTLIAGDHIVATDACGSHLMGHDPAADWLTPPYHRDRNTLRVAAEAGFGTVNLAEIDYQSEVQAPLGNYYSHITDPQSRVVSWRKTTAEQGLIYRDRQKEFVERYAGQYILLQQGEVRWHDPSGRPGWSRRVLSGDNPEEAMFLKYVDPDEFEGENYQIYENTLSELRAMGLA